MASLLKGPVLSALPLPGSMLFADDIVLCGDDETDMTEYLEEIIRGQRNEDQHTKKTIHRL